MSFRMVSSAGLRTSLPPTQLSFLGLWLKFDDWDQDNAVPGLETALAGAAMGKCHIFNKRWEELTFDVFVFCKSHIFEIMLIQLTE